MSVTPKIMERCVGSVSKVINHEPDNRDLNSRMDIYFPLPCHVQTKFGVDPGSFKVSRSPFSQDNGAEDSFPSHAEV
jgi:hypothetical protein